MTSTYLLHLSISIQIYHPNSSLHQESPAMYRNTKLPNSTLPETKHIPRKLVVGRRVSFLLRPSLFLRGELFRFMEGITSFHTQKVRNLPRLVVTCLLSTSPFNQALLQRLKRLDLGHQHKHKITGGVFMGKVTIRELG